ncbi:hypothetical protein NQ317_012930 [Molorchus minor]|uniref:DUF5641 domain-containing protein n=1 Tax=Molorchus minor TaxID=1323400 RepID=A0ABQ9IQS7_9CUCU|nr:hypothetical protein NQ317_012930 [Molorchus minor]
MSELRDMVKKRGSLKARVTHLSNFIKNLQSSEEIDEIDIIELEQRLARSELLIREFDEVQIAIESQDENPEGQYEEREKFEKAYFHTTSLGQKLLNSTVRLRNMKQQNSIVDGREGSAGGRDQALFNLDVIQKESSVQLRKLIDNVTKNLRALNTLEQPTDHWDTLIIYIIVSKLDSVTAREWEEYRTQNDIDIPSLENMTLFIKNRSDLLETIESNRAEKKSYKGSDSNHKVRSLASTTDRATSHTCPICKGNHKIHSCGDFLRLSNNERYEKAKALRLCLNCLKGGHSFTACRLGPCTKCTKRHNTLLHFENANVANPVADRQPNTHVENSSDIGVNNNVALSSCNIQGQVLLSTAMVQILDKNNVAHSVRVLLDAGSQSCFITDNLRERLELDTIDTEVTISGINNTISRITKICKVTIHSNHNDFHVTLNCLLATFWQLEEIPNKIIWSQEEQDCENHFKQNMKRLDNGHFLVSIPFKDDLTKLGDSYEKAKSCFLSLERKLQNTQELKQLLRKWRSNEPTVSRNIAESDRLDKFMHFSDSKESKTLGLIWSSKHDVLSFNITDEHSKPITKRTLLSCIARIFDPLGLLSPCVIIAKVMLQELWLERLSWDDQVPNKLQSSWQSYVSELPELNKLQIKRFVLCNVPQSIELHGFSDSSAKAYGGLKHCMAYVIRFISNCRVKRDFRQVGQLTLPELKNSFEILIKLSQIESFSDEYSILVNKKQFSPKFNRLLKLSPFLDSNNLIRVGGRLNNSEFDYNKRHPYILSGKHKLTKLLFSHEHKRLMHAGPQQLLYSIRESHIWKRWRTEYIAELQSKTKWTTHQPPLDKDTMVLIKDDQLPPLKWSIGRVVQTFPGKDGIARVAAIKTSKGIIRRAFSKICPLPRDPTDVERHGFQGGGHSSIKSTPCEAEPRRIPLAKQEEVEKLANNMQKRLNCKVKFGTIPYKTQAMRTCKLATHKIAASVLQCVWYDAWMAWNLI